MHAWSDYQPVEHSLQRDGEAKITVVKDCGACKNGFISCVDKGGNAQESNLCQTEGHREQNLDEVKAEGGCYIQVRIQMMHVVEAPENREDVVGSVPPVKGEVHKHEGEEKLEGSRKRYQSQQAEIILIVEL